MSGPVMKLWTDVIGALEAAESSSAAAAQQYDALQGILATALVNRVFDMPAVKWQPVLQNKVSFIHGHMHICSHRTVLPKR